MLHVGATESQSLVHTMRYLYTTALATVVVSDVPYESDSIQKIGMKNKTVQTLLSISGVPSHYFHRLEAARLAQVTTQLTRRLMCNGHKAYSHFYLFISYG